MSIISRFFAKSAVITSEMIQAEIQRAESEILTLQSKLAAARSGIMFMSDSEHRAVEADAAATERAITRLDQRIAHLQSELPAVLAAEEAAAKAAADAALIKRADECRKENNKTAALLLKEYGEHANAIGDIIAKLNAMDATRAAINAELRTNAVCETVASYSDIHRTTPGTEATEQRAKVPCWVYRYPGSPADTEKTKYQFEAPREEVRRATIGPDGKPVPAGNEIYHYYGRELIIVPTLEKREMVVSRTYARPPQYAHPLDDVRLPPGFAENGKWHWPRS